MTDNERELLNLIRKNDNPERAFVKAIEIILSHLTHHEASELESFVEFREYV